MPNESRELATWLSEPYFERLLLACLTAPKVDYTVVYGVSNNRDSWWDNEKSAARLGFVPQDDASAHFERVHQQVERGESPGPYPMHRGKRAESGLATNGNDSSEERRVGKECVSMSGTR